MPPLTRRSTKRIEPAAAATVNSQAVGVLAEEAKKLGALLVHYSTDYVFDGSKPVPTPKTMRPTHSVPTAAPSSKAIARFRQAAAGI